MIKTSIYLIYCFLIANTIVAQEKPAYIIYDSSGEKVSYQGVISAAGNADLFFFGELHNNPVAHWLELEITLDLAARTDSGLVLGFEMLERDDQLQINEYFSGKYQADKFEAEVKLWPNHKTDYKPIIDFALEASVKVVATNIPRRYASMVSKGGFEVLDSLSDDAKKFIAPLPIVYDPEVKCYKDMLNSEEMGPHVTENFPKAQAVKDATMAFSILENLDSDKIFIHYNGSYHSSNFEGIIWYVNHYKPGLKIVTLEIVEQEDITTLEEDYHGAASFIVVVPERMTKTY